MTKKNADRIPIKNIYYMLAYAFQFLQYSQFEEAEVEEFEHIYDMFAAILARGVAKQLKQGLYKTYVNEMDYLSSLRGKIHIQESIRLRLQKKQLLACEYDEFSENNLWNQILKTSMFFLMKKEDVSEKWKVLLKKNLCFFGKVEQIEPSSIAWKQIRFQKQQQNYRVLLNVCYLLLDGLLLSTEKGNQKWASFFDEQRMSRLYEKFLLEYYKYHYAELSPHAAQISWNVEEEYTDFLPRMQTDITLTNGTSTLIIDAKYYAHMMQKQYDKNTLYSNHLYQIYAYVKNMDREHSGKVMGMLLYARTQEDLQMQHQFTMEGNKIMVDSLDLNVPFPQIAEKLNQIAHMLTG